jgi:hypothetical protein
MASSISINGIQNGIQHMNFTLNDGAAELGDNEFDAGANTLRYIFTTASNTITVAGDGSGMNEAALVRSVCYFASKDASTSVGRFGLGENAAHIVLSGALTSTHILTRTEGAVRPLELIANWPRAAAEDSWAPSAHPISYDSMGIWNQYAINPNGKGSVKYIPMPADKFASMVANLPSLLKELGFAYEHQLRSGKVIEVYVDGVCHLPDMSLTLNYDTTPAVRRNETRIELWKKGDDERVYYHHTSTRPLYAEMVRQDVGSQTKIRDYATAGADGYARVAEFTLRSVYDPASNPPAIVGQPRGEVVPGYVALHRGNRTLCRLPGLFPGTSGDYEDRRVVGATRHWLSFTHNEDTLMGVETNKSHVREEKVHKLLLDTVHDLGRRWSKKYYQTIKAAAAVAPPENVAWARRVKAAVSTMKRLADSAPGFLEELEAFMDEFEVPEPVEPVADAD